MLPSAADTDIDFGRLISEPCEFRRNEAELPMHWPARLPGHSNLPKRVPWAVNCSGNSRMKLLSTT